MVSPTEVYGNTEVRDNKQRNSQSPSFPLCRSGLKGPTVKRIWCMALCTSFSSVGEVGATLRGQEIYCQLAFLLKKKKKGGGGATPLSVCVRACVRVCVRVRACVMDRGNNNNIQERDTERRRETKRERDRETKRETERGRDRVRCFVVQSMDCSLQMKYGGLTKEAEFSLAHRQRDNTLCNHFACKQSL